MPRSESLTDRITLITIIMNDSLAIYLNLFYFENNVYI